MFSVPAIYGNTPAERNDRRMEGLNYKIIDAEQDLREALVRLETMRETFGNLTAEDMAGLDYGQCNNLANTTGRLVADVQRALGRAHETLTEVTVVGAGFEAVV